MMYYIGIVALPAKLDYWTTSPYHSFHKITHELGMTQDRFQFLWRHFHIRKSNVKGLEEEEQENDDKDDEEE